MADEKPDEAKEEQAAPEKPAKSKLGLIFAVVDLLVMGGGAFWIYTSTLGHSPEVMQEEAEIEKLVQERESKAAESVLYMMEPFSVNLTGTTKRQLTVEMHLEMLDGDGFEDVVDMGAEARDAIMKLLENKTFREIESIQGKLFLKDQIATTVNSFLQNGVVKDIFFSQFLVE